MSTSPEEQFGGSDWGIDLVEDIIWGVRLDHRPPGRLIWGGRLDQRPPGRLIWGVRLDQRPPGGVIWGVESDFLPVLPQKSLLTI